MRRRSRSSPPGATVTSTAELPCSVTPTVAVRCFCPLATPSSFRGARLTPSLTLVRITSALQPLRSFQRRSESESQRNGHRSTGPHLGREHRVRLQRLDKSHVVSRHISCAVL